MPEQVPGVLIDGNLREITPDTKEFISVTNPRTEEKIWDVACADPFLHIDYSVESAQHAFEQWQFNPHRAEIMRTIARVIRENKDFLTQVQQMENGKLTEKEAAHAVGMQMTCDGEVDEAAEMFEYYAQFCDDKKHPEKFFTYSKRERETSLPDVGIHVSHLPAGVIGIVTPWNFPLSMIVQKIAPALSAGCTVIVKPSEYTPRCGVELIRLMYREETGLARGVVNLLSGGGDVGAALVKHPGLDKVTFTGSVPTGKKIMNAAAEGVKDTCLELGGKSPLIALEDCDIDDTVESIIYGIFDFAGQICSATSRILLHRNIAETVLSRLWDVVNDPKKMPLTPIVSQKQYQMVQSFLEKAKEEQLNVAFGGLDSMEEMRTQARYPTGYYIPPTLYRDVSEKSDLWHQEIFGPVACMRTFETEDEAIALANDTEYGLAAVVMSQDPERAHKLLRKIRAGVCWVNCNQPVPVEGPWGGFKQSGIGRELGPEAVQFFLDTQQIITRKDASEI